jgi:hypothetical protein
MVTINNLEVQFDVEGEGDDAAFARLFQKYSSKQEETRERQRWLARERDFGDGHTEEN